MNPGKDKHALLYQDQKSGKVLSICRARNFQESMEALTRDQVTLTKSPAIVNILKTCSEGSDKIFQIQNITGY